MVARDVNSQPLQYRTWVNDIPDLTGQLYTGLKSGDNPMVDTKVYLVLDDTAILDYNLPVPLSWNITYKVLPDAIADSQLAIIDGYAYLFGGNLTDKIYRADINNPADWTDTGAVLPSTLYGASLAVIDGIIYLFGGNDGYQAKDTIYFAYTTDPLTWYSMGSLLPEPVYYSSLGMANGNLFLFGGNINGSATNQIFSSTTSNPFSWTIDSNTLPAAIYGATVAQSDGYWYLFGGETSPGHFVNTIYKSPLDSSFWFLNSSLPYPSAFGQFFSINNDGYYLGPSPGDIGSGFTTILQSPMSDLGQWIDTRQLLPGVVSHSQVAIIVDRVWTLGGTGMSAIFTCDQEVKYDLTTPSALQYGIITRTNFQATDNLTNPYQAVGIPWWKTSYQL